jgi:hypothetical protein
MARKAAFSAPTEQPTSRSGRTPRLEQRAQGADLRGAEAAAAGKDHRVAEAGGLRAGRAAVQQAVQAGHRRPPPPECQRAGTRCAMARSD